jgi:peptidase E
MPVEARTLCGDGPHHRRRTLIGHTAAMDLFLGSQGLGALAPWLGEGLTRRPRRAVLVPTAGNPMSETPWVDVAEAAMAAEGLSVQRFDLEPATPGEVPAALADTDLVFVTGGYTIFLLQHATPRSSPKKATATTSLPSATIKR